jgi:transposase InsO family protein
MREWFALSELAGLPGLPGTVQGLNGLAEVGGWRGTSLARKRSGRGGGWEYHYSLLPAEAATILLARVNDANDAPAMAGMELTPELKLWGEFDALGEPAKKEGARRLRIVRQVDALRRGGTAAQAAVALVAAEAEIATSTLWNWLRLTDGLAADHWLAALAPRRLGRTATADCDDRAWQFLSTDYLRAERPAFAACWRRMVEAAAAHGWSPIPSAKTLQRRLEKEYPRGAMTLARHGRDAAKALYPAQRRDRSQLAALQAVNADGHRFDVFVRWEDGTIGRPIMLAIQDLYSGVVVGHHIDRTENKNSVRLAFAAMVTRYGIPEVAVFDNGRAFASKWITGRQVNRFRFTIRDEEPAGILTQLGIEVRWTQPYSGQSKPIERAFRDLCEEIAKHPAVAGAYVGNRPDAKPENYGSRAVPIAEFRALVARELARHNAREGRAGGNCAGRSFDQTLADGMTSALVRRATPQQRRMLLLAAEAVPTDRRNGEIRFEGNRYWSPALVDHAGSRVVLRLDPDALHEPMAVYGLDGRFICEAECIEDVGFADIDAARRHAANRNAWLKLQRELAAVESRLTIDEVAALMPAPPAPPVTEPSIVKLVVNGAPRIEQPATDGAASAENFARGLDRIFGNAGNVLPFPNEEGGRG